MIVFENASATVVNSIFSENYVYGFYPGAGFAVTTGDASGELINCVFVGNNGLHAYGGGVGIKGGSVVMNNCILWDNDPYQIEIVYGSGGTLDINYSCIQDGWAGFLNIISNPLFVDLAGGDYRLTSSSPCIDTGNPLASIITDDSLDLDNDGDTTEATPDLDLNNRISSPDDECQVVDMGAYEFVQGCCQWDIDDDDVVSTADLLLLFAEWGTDPEGPPDFNCDGDVDTDDLLELFANWGRCECAPPGSEPLSFEDELDDACITEAEWDDYEDIMQTGTEEEKENYQCWMLHWIEDCNRCSCLGQSGCPGEDPFD